MAGRRVLIAGLCFSVCLDWLSNHGAVMSELVFVFVIVGFVAVSLVSSAAGRSSGGGCVCDSRYRGAHCCRFRGDEQADAPYVIVLGAGVNGDVPSLSLQNRLLAAQRWLTNHPDSKAILSGGQGPGENISEAQCMYQWLTQYGIAGERLLLEDQSRSTRENFKYSAALLQADNGGVLPEQVAVISSEYHLYRAGLLAEQLVSI